MGEALREFSFEPVREKGNNEKSIENILGHLRDIEVFFDSDYVTQTRKQKFGFSRIEYVEDVRKVEALKKKLLNFSERETEIVPDNHMDHILGNSITTAAGGFARRFEGGKYFSEEGAEKQFPVEQFKMAKEGMELMLYYIEELANDDELIVEEVGSRIGYLGHFLEYLSCDLPSQTTEQLKLFRFFRDLKMGRITQDNFLDSIEKKQKYLNMEKIQEELL